MNYQTSTACKELGSSPHDFVVDMIDWVIEDRVRQAPYIATISKRQLWFGNGTWKNSPDPDLSKGLRGFLGIRIPSQAEIENKNMFYGYQALHGPWSYLNTITNHAIRAGLLWNTIDEKKYSDIRVILGKGYIREDGTLDPNQTKGISCYVLFNADPIFREEQNDWIRMQPDWIQLQILRNIMTHRELLAERAKSASVLVKNNRKLLALDEYKQLNVPIDREKIPWDADEDTRFQLKEQF